MLAALEGQWIGHYNGTNQGLLVVDLDDRGSYYAGTATLVDDRADIVPLMVPIRTSDKTTQQVLELLAYPYDVNAAPNSATFQQPRAAPIQARVNISYDGALLHVAATTNISTKIDAPLSRSQASTPSALLPLASIADWVSFKDFVTRLELGRYIFRGQDQRLRLRTRFHRTGRADILRFQAEDVPAVYKRLSAAVSYRFDFAKAEEYGAFLSLVQHYGYPTPLLDWTYSPFVAAFFAYQRISEDKVREASDTDRVRIFAFDKASWESTFPQLSALRPYGLHFSTAELLAIGNDRAIPQQSTSTVTNVDDIEQYIAQKEAESGRSFLQAIDLPVLERPTVMAELSLMGVTAGSLFPGLDGACEELKERYFRG